MYNDDDDGDISSWCCDAGELRESSFIYLPTYRVYLSVSCGFFGGGFRLQMR